jgi:AcrR family transcriptional regulator
VSTPKAEREVRPKRLLANDERIRSKAVELLAERGFDDFSLWLVARSLGMSHTAMTHRYENVDDLLCDIWKTVGAVQVETMLLWVNGQLLGSAEKFESQAMATKRSILTGSKENYATMEMLLLSSTRPQLRKVVQETFASQLVSLSKDDSVVAAQTVFLLAMVIGILAEQRSTKTNSQALTKAISDVVVAVSAPAQSVVLDAVDASHMQNYSFDTGDERKNRVLKSCLENVGRHGYTASTTKMIAREAEVSEGAIFTMFKSKADIFFEATTLRSRLGFKANLDFIIQLNEKYGSGIGNAIILREWMSPALAQFRATLLEESRLVWHDSELRKRIKKNKKELMADPSVPNWKEKRTPDEDAMDFISLALPIGFYVMAEVFPPAADLPFSAVTQSVF